MKHKSTILMLVLFALIILAVQPCKSQGWDDYCTQPKFRAMYLYGMGHGGGLEIGVWPQEDKLGYFGGVAYQEVRSGVKGDTTTVTMLVYGKALYRLNRFVYLTGTGGVANVVNGDAFRVYAMAGIRFSVPIGRGNVAAVIAEPQYGTLGFRMTAGVGIAF